MKEKTDWEKEMLTHPYNGVLRHAHMSMESRAAQFAPFAALVGYSKAIREVRERHIGGYERKEGTVYDASGNLVEEE